MLSKLISSPNVFTGSRITSYHDNIEFKELNFRFSETSPEKILNQSKAAGIDNLSRKFLKDGADILAIPISRLRNLSIKLNSFPRSCKIAMAKTLFKKAPQLILKTTAPVSLLPLLLKIIERIDMTKHRNFWVKTKFFTDLNLASK